MDHQSQYMILKTNIALHCHEACIDYGDFLNIWTGYINDPAIFDPFFEIPFDQITEPLKDARVELLIDLFTLD